MGFGERKRLRGDVRSSQSSNDNFSTNQSHDYTTQTPAVESQIFKHVMRLDRSRIIKSYCYRLGDAICGNA